jgi:hypothetical protein
MASDDGADRSQQGLRQSLDHGLFDLPKSVALLLAQAGSHSRLEPLARLVAQVDGAITGRVQDLVQAAQLGFNAIVFAPCLDLRPGDAVVGIEQPSAQISRWWVLQLEQLAVYLGPLHGAIRVAQASLQFGRLIAQSAISQDRRVCGQLDYRPVSMFAHQRDDDLVGSRAGLSALDVQLHVDAHAIAVGLGDEPLDLHRPGGGRFGLRLMHHVKLARGDVDLAFDFPHQTVDDSRQTVWGARRVAGVSVLWL